jgi:FkbM family methyltransferase
MQLTAPPGYPAARSYPSGLYEPEVTAFFKSLITPGMTVVDIGANVGYYTLLAAHLSGPAGRVYAFEPDPLSYQYLSANIALNNCPSVTAVQSAVSNRAGGGRFVVDPDGVEGYLTEDDSRDVAIEVTNTSLDSFLEKEGWPDVGLIKLDVEGGEKRVLEGMRQVSARNPSLALIMELNGRALTRSGATVDEVQFLLIDLGFSVGYVVERGMKSFPIASGIPRSQATYDLVLRKQDGSPR